MDTSTHQSNGPYSMPRVNSISIFEFYSSFFRAVITKRNIVSQSVMFQRSNCNLCIYTSVPRYGPKELHAGGQ